MVNKVVKKIFMGLCLFFLVVMQQPVIGAEVLVSKYAKSLADDDKTKILDLLKEMKEKLESGDSGYTLRSFMNEGKTEIIPVMDPETYGFYSIQVTGKKENDPEKVQVHIPEVLKRRGDKAETYLKLTIDFKHVRLVENWKLLLVKNNENWKLEKKVLLQLGTPLYKLTTKDGQVYQVTNLEFKHDRFVLKMGHAKLTPIYAKDKQIGVVLLGKGKVSFVPPDSVETYQLKRFIKKSKLNTAVDSVVFTFSQEGYKNFVEQLDLKPVEDHSVSRKLRKIYDGRKSFADIMEKYVFLYEKTNMFTVEFRTEHYGWVAYDHDPRQIKEVTLYREKKYSISTFRGVEVWCQYHSEEDRLTKTPLQMELEQKTNIDMLKLQADVTITKTETMKVKTEIKYAPLLDDLKYTTISIHPSLKIKCVQDTQGNNLLFYQDHGSLYVYFMDIAARKSIQTLTMEYSAKEFTEQVTHDTYYVKLNWFPSWRSFDRHYFDFTIHVPEPYIALSNGYQENTWEEDGYNVSHWTSEYQIAFPAIMYGKYEVKKDVADGIPVYLYATLENYTQMKPILIQALDAIKFFNKIYGRYPYEQLVLVESAVHGFGAQAPTGFIFVGSTNFTSLSERAASWRTTILGRGTISHEVSHQWWGSMVRPISEHEYWWVESLAQFSESLFMHAALGNEAFKNELFQWKSRAMDVDHVGPLQLGYRLGYGNGVDLIYYKGPYVFHMLRMMFSSKKMTMFLKNVVQAFKFKESISTRILEMVAEKTFRTKLDWFFDQWVRNNGTPTVYWKYKVTPKKGKYLVHITLEQKVFAGKEELPNIYFTLPLKVRFYFGKDQVAKKDIWLNKSKFEKVIKVPEKPKKITLNEFDSVLCKIKKL